MVDGSIQQTTLWQRSFGSQAFEVAQGAVDRLQSGLIDMRSKAKLLASEIGRDLPDFTGHDIEHLDSLWETADTLVGQELSFNPAAAFVFGAAVLTHDLAMSRAAYAIVGDGLRSQPQWPDHLAATLRREYGRPPHPSEIVQPPEDVARLAEAGMLRELHAKQAEVLPMGQWRGLDGSVHHFIADADLRSTYGRLVGRIAASHHWYHDSLVREFSKPVGAPAFAPPDWKVDPLLIACLVRTADAAHLDGKRAPDLLAAVRGVSIDSRNHWVFQSKMQKPYLDNDKLVFTAPAGFSDEEIEAWWLAYDMIKAIDSELRGVDSILVENGRPRLSAHAVAGANSPRSFGELAECLGWEAVDTQVQVTDVANLVRRLGGEQLYGRDASASIRELLVNASDAVKAREALQAYRGGHEVRSFVEISIDSTGDEAWLEVADNGIGMSPDVLSGPLLDFGCSSWLSSVVALENPGLLASRFAPTGRFGIGFFSVFMLGKKVTVNSRALSAGREDTWILDFGDGLDRRPILRRAKPGELLEEPGTCVRVMLDNEVRGLDGGIHVTFKDPLMSGRFMLGASEGSLEQAIRYVLPAPEAPIWVGDSTSGESRQIMAANDWLIVEGEALLCRIFGGWADLSAMREGGADQALLDVVQHYGPKIDVVANLDGTPAARICGVDEVLIRKVGWAGPHGSVVTAGSARTETGVFGVVGLVRGAPTRAARDSALPTITPELIAEWATREVQKADERGLSRQEWWWAETFAEAMRVLGGAYGSVPLWLVGDERMNEAELREWLRSRDEVLVVHPAHLLVRIGMNNQSADPAPGTVWFEDGSRPALINATRSWPLPDADNTHNQGTLFEKAIAEAWGAPFESVKQLRRRFNQRKTKVAKFNGEDIFADAELITRAEVASSGTSEIVGSDSDSGSD